MWPYSEAIAQGRALGFCAMADWGRETSQQRTLVASFDSVDGGSAAGGLPQAEGERPRGHAERATSIRLRGCEDGGMKSSKEMR